MEFEGFSRVIDINETVVKPACNEVEEKLMKNVGLSEKKVTFNALFDEAKRTEEEKKDAAFLFDAQADSLTINEYRTEFELKYNSRKAAFDGKLDGENNENAQYINDRVYNKYSHRWQKTRKKRLNTSAEKLEKAKTYKKELKDDVEMSSAKRVSLYENYYKKINESDRNLSEALSFNENEEKLLKQKADSVLVINLSSLYSKERLNLWGIILKKSTDENYDERLSLVEGTETEKIKTKEKYINDKAKIINGLYKDYKNVIDKSIKLAKYAKGNKDLVLPKGFKSAEEIEKGYEEEILRVSNYSEILMASDIKKDQDKLIKENKGTAFDPLSNLEKNEIDEFSEIIDSDEIEKIKLKAGDTDNDSQHGDEEVINILKAMEGEDNKIENAPN